MVSFIFYHDFIVMLFNATHGLQRLVCNRSCFLGEEEVGEFVGIVNSLLQMNTPVLKEDYFVLFLFAFKVRVKNVLFFLSLRCYQLCSFC